MVRKENDQIYMVSTKAEILETFLFKVERFYKHSFRYKRLRRIMVFKSEGEAIKCMKDIQEAEGVSLCRTGKRIRIEIPKELVLLI